MDIQSLQKHFGRIGARVKIAEAGDSLGRRQFINIDIGADAKGEYFDIKWNPLENGDLFVVNVEPKMKHLLLMARRWASAERFLCGHDERHWFVSAVPNDGVVNVKTAFDALRPGWIRREVGLRVKPKNRYSRRNEVFVRQGEWFFIPAPWMREDTKLALKNEPLSRGAGSKPHMCEYMLRFTGEAVWVCSKYPRGVSPEKYARIVRSNPDARNWDWTPMRRNSSVFVTGRVWHPDHKTITLDGWHQVMMNTEAQAPGSQSVAFLD
jgi:hypothetical protein